MSRSIGGHTIVASLNTCGLPLADSKLAERYGAIAAAFEASAVDIVAFQEVHTYHHLRRLASGMPSFRHVGYRRSLAGPAGGLVTLSRLRITRCVYRRFPLSPRASGLPRFTRPKAALKGSLNTRFEPHGLSVVNTHPIANTDGDWSPSNRFHHLQRRQLGALADLVRETPRPLIVCGDFNVARDSELFREFMATTELTDVFEGQCQPTFHSRYLSQGRSAHCIDFILTAGSIKVESTDVLFTGEEPLPSGPSHLSDHIGLSAHVTLDGSATVPETSA